MARILALAAVALALFSGCHLCAATVEESFCCLSSEDVVDACGTCFPSAMRLGGTGNSSNWCGESEDNCATCNNATWCEAETTVASTTSGQQPAVEAFALVSVAALARTTASLTTCHDASTSWADLLGATCADYARGHLCTSSGGHGSGWSSSNRSFASRVAGATLPAHEACCACGGGVLSDDSAHTRRRRAVDGDEDEDGQGLAEERRLQNETETDNNSKTSSILIPAPTPRSYQVCSSHHQCNNSSAPFCYFYAGSCTSCDECHYCHDGVDGTCGDCGAGFPTRESGPCGQDSTTTSEEEHLFETTTTTTDAPETTTAGQDSSSSTSSSSSPASTTEQEVLSAAGAALLLALGLAAAGR